MAVIKAVSSKAGIGHAIDYVTKKEKTEEKLVSGLHCEPETVKEEMQATSMIFQFLKVYQNNIAVISKINCSLSVRRKRCKNVLIRLAVKARGSEV